MRRKSFACQRPQCRRSSWLYSVLIAACWTCQIHADEAIPYTRVAPIFQKHCLGCHGDVKTKGKLRIDKLDPDLVGGKDGERWRDVLDRLNIGDMPPEKEPPLAKDDRDLLTSWLNQERRRAALAKNSATQFRRLTRLEYQRTMQDLLGLPIDFGSRLPEDGRSKDGFRNDGDMLRMSPQQYETYLQIADDALAEALASGPVPVVHRFRLSVGPKHDKYEVTQLPRPEGLSGESFEYQTKKGKAFRIWNMSTPAKDWDESLPPSAIRRFNEAAVQIPANCVAFGFHYAYRKGETRIKVHVARIEPKDKEAARLPYLTVAVGSTNYHGVELKTVGEPVVIDHTDFRTYEFRVRMENVSVPNTGPPADKNAAVVACWNSARMIKGEKDAPKLKIEWIEFESPFFEAWPPPANANILIDQGALDEPAYAKEVVRRFATRAYRGPLSSVELDRLLKYWANARKNSDSLEASLRETLSVVLSSPRFLALPASRLPGKETQRLSEHELASRLSYFLWSTMPDATLIDLADRSQLRASGVLPKQIHRMIQDPKAWPFIEQFTDQWLDLERLQRVTVKKERYPNFDETLAAAMRQETIHLIGDVLRGDMSIFRLLDADFTFVNDSLAAHYGIAGIDGPKFRKVKLDPALHRGGILTHASILTANSDGIDGHPIKRGIWLLKNLLDETPPPPPPNVPELDRENNPKVRNLSITQALAVHRNSTACVGCHRKIDPWGIAFEEYDAVGNWQRDGIGAELRKKRTKEPIDAKAELPTGAKVDGMNELRDELLRSKADAFRRAMLRKVMAYALGRTLTLQDIEAADALVPALRERGDRLAAVIELVVASESFQAK